MNKERGGLSKREYAALYGNTGSTNTTNATSIASQSSGDLYQTLQSNISNLQQQYADVTGTLNTAGLSKNLYQQTGGTAVDSALKAAQQRQNTSYSDSMEKYTEKGITNPEYQDALASQSQDIAGIAVTGLQSEQERRTAIIDEYVNLWSDTYGAKAKAAQTKATSKTSFLQEARQTIESSLSAVDENGNFVQTKDGTVDAQTYAQLRNQAIDYGMSASAFDGYFKNYLSDDDAASLDISGASSKTETMTQGETWNFLQEEVKNNPDITDEELQELAIANNIDVSPTSTFSKSWKSNLEYNKYANQAKKSSGEAEDGEYYLDEEGNVYQRVKGWGGDKLIVSKPE